MALIKQAMEAPPEDMGEQSNIEDDAASAAPVEGEEPVEDDGASDDDPRLQQALKFAMDALYQSGAAQQIAGQLKSAQDLPQALAEVSYNIVSIADEKTDGAIPDELLVLFASHVIEEVVDVAQAAGVKVPGSAIAQAVKLMILRYLGENGVDTTELQSAMDKVDPAEFDKMDQGESDDAPAPAETPPEAEAATDEEVM